MKHFSDIQQRAIANKGGKKELANLLYDVATDEDLRQISDDRYLAAMTRCVFNAGFHWRVITAKWPGFEEAFEGFDPEKVATFSMKQFEELCVDTRIVRNRQKIFTVRANARLIMDISFQFASFGNFLAEWPKDDQIGLMAYLKKTGSRLGGNTSTWFFRNCQKDSFVFTRDVIAALKSVGLDIADNPTTKRDQNKIQQTFNEWHEQTNLPYTHLSQLAAFSIG